MKTAIKNKVPKQLYPNISTRITLPFLLTILIIAVIGAFIVTRLVAGNIQERLNTQLLDSAQAASNTVVEAERQIIAVLRLMSFTEGIAQNVRDRNTAGIDVLLRSVAANHAVDDVIVFDLTGDTLYRYKAATLNAAPTSTLPQTRNWASVQRVIGGEVDEQGDKFVEVQQLEGEFTFLIAGPITDDSDKLVGGMLIGMSNRSFVRLLKEQAVASIVLLDRDGGLMGSSFRDAVSGKLAMSRDQMRDLGEQQQVDASTTLRYEIDNATYQFIYAPLQMRSAQLGWVGVALPVDFVSDRISTSRDIFFVFFMIVLGVVVVIGVTVSGSIIRPVFRILDTTRAIRAGDLSRRANLKSPDELGELSQSLDHMTTELLKRSRKINKLYAEQLEETVRRDAVLTSISDAVIVMDTQDQPILTNAAAEVLMQSVEENPEYMALFSNPLQYSQPRNATVGNRHFNVLSTPVRLPSGELLGYVVVFRDVTSLVEAERVKDEVILQLSHELRTPLTAAKGYVELVKMMGSETIPEMFLDFLGKAHNQIKTLGGMVDQVIEVNGMLANRFSIDAQMLDLTALLVEVIDTYRETIQAAQHKLIVTLPDAPIWVKGDTSRLTQVFGNIIKNAYSYTLPGGWIEIYLETDVDQQVVVRVYDSGVGIDEDEIEKVFEKLYRGRSADAGPTDTRGLGLGLYISRQIIEAHNGKIMLESEVNVGTTVAIILPWVQETTLHYDAQPNRQA